MEKTKNYLKKGTYLKISNNPAINVELSNYIYSDFEVPWYILLCPQSDQKVYTYFLLPDSLIKVGICATYITIESDYC